MHIISRLGGVRGYSVKDEWIIKAGESSNMFVRVVTHALYFGATKELLYILARQLAHGNE